MSECIICREDLSESEIINSPCNHGPYCQSCYNTITSPLEPACSICRGSLPRSDTPNPRYINGFTNISNIYNFIDYTNMTNLNYNYPIVANRYIPLEIISNGYESQDEEIHINQQNQIQYAPADSANIGYQLPQSPQSPQSPQLPRQEHITNEANEENGANEEIDNIQEENMYTTPTRRPVINSRDLRQLNIRRRALLNNRINSYINNDFISETLDSYFNSLATM